MGTGVFPPTVLWHFQTDLGIVGARNGFPGFYYGYYVKNIFYDPANPALDPVWFFIWMALGPSPFRQTDRVALDAHIGDILWHRAAAIQVYAPVPGEHPPLPVPVRICRRIIFAAGKQAGG